MLHCCCTIIRVKLPSDRKEQEWTIVLTMLQRATIPAQARGSPLVSQVRPVLQWRHAKQQLRVGLNGHFWPRTRYRWRCNKRKTHVILLQLMMRQLEVNGRSPGSAFDCHWFKASTVINVLFSFLSYKFYLNQIFQIGVVDTDLRWSLKGFSVTLISSYNSGCLDFCFVLRVIAVGKALSALLLFIGNLENKWFGWLFCAEAASRSPNPQVWFY